MVLLDHVGRILCGISIDGIGAVTEIRHQILLICKHVNNTTLNILGIGAQTSEEIDGTKKMNMEYFNLVHACVCFVTHSRSIVGPLQIQPPRQNLPF